MTRRVARERGRGRSRGAVDEGAAAFGGAAARRGGAGTVPRCVAVRPDGAGPTPDRAAVRRTHRCVAVPPGGAGPTHRAVPQAAPGRLTGARRYVRTPRDRHPGAPRTRRRGSSGVVPVHGRRCRRGAGPGGLDRPARLLALGPPDAARHQRDGHHGRSRQAVGARPVPGPASTPTRHAGDGGVGTTPLRRPRPRLRPRLRRPGRRPGRARSRHPRGRTAVRTARAAAGTTGTAAGASGAAGRGDAVDLEHLVLARARPPGDVPGELVLPVRQRVVLRVPGAGRERDLTGERGTVGDGGWVTMLQVTSWPWSKLAASM